MLIGISVISYVAASPKAIAVKQDTGYVNCVLYCIAEKVESAPASKLPTGKKGQCLLTDSFLFVEKHLNLLGKCNHWLVFPCSHLRCPSAGLSQ